METKRHQKLYEHYENILGQKSSFSLKLKKNVLSNDMKPIITFVFELFVKNSIIPSSTFATNIELISSFT